MYRDYFGLAIFFHNMMASAYSVYLPAILLQQPYQILSLHFISHPYTVYYIRIIRMRQGVLKFKIKQFRNNLSIEFALSDNFSLLRVLPAAC